MSSLVVDFVRNFKERFDPGIHVFFICQVNIQLIINCQRLINCGYCLLKPLSLFTYDVYRSQSTQIHSVITHWGFEVNGNISMPT